MYRSIDAGLRAIDIRTLTEAAQSLGAGWARASWSRSSCPTCGRAPERRLPDPGHRHGRVHHRLVPRAAGVRAVPRPASGATRPTAGRGRDHQLRPDLAGDGRHRRWRRTRLASRHPVAGATDRTGATRCHGLPRADRRAQGVRLAHRRRSRTSTWRREKGEFVSFLGPSGCGKTTTLRMIAGFERPTSGTIVIDVRGRHRPARPNRRNVGMVFQSYALFPNMTVADNIGFGLKIARATRRPRSRSASTRCWRSSSCPSFGERYPYQLSGGQQQRVALARALAIEPQRAAARRAALRARRQDPRRAARRDPRASSASWASPRST